jgi:hypothetical protein
LFLDISLSVRERSHINHPDEVNIHPKKKCLMPFEELEQLAKLRTRNRAQIAL